MFWRPDPARHTQWTEWDYALAEAYRTRENFTDRESGQPRWLAEDPDVLWEVGHTKSHAAVDLHRANEEVQDEPGHSVYLKNPQKMNGEFWTIDEWLGQLEGDGMIMERGAVEGARPPTAEELAAIRERRLKAAEGTPIE